MYWRGITCGMACRIFECWCVVHFALFSSRDLIRLINSPSANDCVLHLKFRRSVAFLAFSYFHFLANCPSQPPNWSPSPRCQGFLYSCSSLWSPVSYCKSQLVPSFFHPIQVVSYSFSCWLLLSVSKLFAFTPSPAPLSRLSTVGHPCGGQFSDARVS